MHKTKIGEFKYLIVICFSEKIGGSDHLFYDTEAEVSEWLSKQMRLFKIDIKKMRTLRDISYLLNEMVSNKTNEIGQTLYKVYIESYPDDDQKKRIIEFWNK
jgi:hypothetical protein